MNVEHSSDPTEKYPKYSVKILSQCHAIHYKFHVYWSGIDPRPPRRVDGDQTPESLDGPILILS
jgi:hypothetical protein